MRDHKNTQSEFEKKCQEPHNGKKVANSVRSAYGQHDRRFPQTGTGTDTDRWKDVPLPQTSGACTFDPGGTA